MPRIPMRWLFAALAVVLPAGCAVWYWYYWPIHHRKALYSEAEQAIAGDERRKADQATRQLLAEYPNDARAHLLRARHLRRLGSPREAQAALDRATRLGLPQREAFRETTLILAVQAFSKAEPALRQLREQQPDDAEVLEALARGNFQKNLPESEALLSRLLELQPERYDLRLVRAKARVAMKLFGKAADDLGEYLTRFPDNIEARHERAECLLNQADMEAAAAELKILNQLRPGQPAVLKGLGICALVRGDIDLSESFFLQASEKDPKETAILNELGAIFLLRKDGEKAIRIFERVLVLNPNDLQAHLNLASALRTRKPPDEARIKKLETRYLELLAEVTKKEGR